MFALYFCYPLSSKPALHTDGYCTVSKDNSAVVSGTPLVPFRADRCVASANVTSLLPSLPVSVPFLPCQNGGPLRKKTLVLDLDETLVHSSFDPSQPHQFSFPVMLDGRVRQVYVSVRPGVESFLQSMSSLYEIVVFTASFHQVGVHSLPHCVVCRRRAESSGSAQSHLFAAVPRALHSLPRTARKGPFVVGSFPVFGGHCGQLCEKLPVAEEEWNRMSTLLGRREGLRAGEPDALSAVSGKEIGAFEGSG